MTHYTDRNGVQTNRVPEGFEAGWQLNTTPPFVPPGTAVKTK